jgi:acyl-CoA thioester hydrolase
VFDLGFRVEYSDTDAMGVVHHASYLRWLERARIEWLRAENLSYQVLESQGLYLPVWNLEINYREPLYFDNEAKISLFFEKMGRCSVTFRYELFYHDRLMTLAKTSHVLCRKHVVDKAKDQKSDKVVAGLQQIVWKPVRLPKEWRVKWEPQKELKI